MVGVCEREAERVWEGERVGERQLVREIEREGGGGSMCAGERETEREKGKERWRERECKAKHQQMRAVGVKTTHKLAESTNYHGLNA